MDDSGICLLFEKWTDSQYPFHNQSGSKGKNLPKNMNITSASPNTSGDGCQGIC